jgi:putative CocE/NonD family hydrolase
MKMRRLLVPAIFFIIGLFCIALPSAEALHTYTEMVPGYDGTLLATDVYLPAETGQWPVLLSRTPYNKGDQNDGFAQLMTVYGFAVVIQDTRGRFGSDGEDTVFRDDGLDGVAAIDWIKKQAWYLPRGTYYGVKMGGIGTYGASALGITQNVLANQAPDGLVCQVVVVAPSNFYSQSVYQGNALRLSLNEGWLLLQAANDAIKANASGNPATANAAEKFFEERYQWYWHLPLKNFPMFNRLMPTWNLTISNPDYSEEFWGPLNEEAHHDQIGVPAYNIGGWYDIFLQGNINNFVGLQQNGADGAKGNQKLVIGPWTHGNWFGTENAAGNYVAQEGQITYPGTANFPSGDSTPTSSAQASQFYFTEHLRWFSYWLYGVDYTGITDEKPVHYFVMGANEWRWADEWPLGTTVYRDYYFHKGGNLSHSVQTDSAASVTYTYDPKDPLPTVGGQNLVIPNGPYDQNATGPRKDVVTFETGDLTDPVEVTGPVKVHLWVSSDCKDTDFTAKLIDVYPDGRAMLVTDGIQRARYRTDGMTQDLLPPNTVAELDIDLWSTSIQFQTGHKIRVDLSSSNFPRFDRNPNTGREFGQDAKTQKAANTIYLDATHPSHIFLPIQPGE